jgi:F420-dependent oxidoreductase-like protein
MRLATSLPALGKTLAGGVERVQLAERLGFESVWSIQTPAGRDTAMVMAAYASSTTKIGIGTAVLPIQTRHPVAMAQMAATLDELSGGRLNLGIGVSHPAMVEEMWRLPSAPPLEAMREYLSILRSSLRDGKVDFSGRHYAAHCEYTMAARPRLPLLVGAVGPKMLELAGELADGVVLWLCTPAYIRAQVIPHVTNGRRRAGRSLDGFDIVALVPVSVTTDIDAGRADLRRSVNHYLTLPYYRRMLTESGFGGEVARGEWSDYMLSQVSGIGTEKAVRDALRRYVAAGCTLPAAWPIEGFRGAAGVGPTLEAAAPLLAA